MNALAAIGAASAAWFVCAGALFFNPIVDRIYRLEEGDPAVKKLPPGGSTIAKILLAVVIQCVAWAYVYSLVEPALPGERVGKGLVFALILILTKIIPRDIDRVLLTTYPSKRMTIEFVVGIVCAGVVGLVFAFVL